MTARLFFTVLFLLVAIFPAASSAAEQLRINCTVHSPTEVLFVNLVDEIARRANLTIRWQTPPVGRSLLNVNEGMDDGDGPRIEGLEKQYPNMIRVPEPFGHFNFSAFAKDPEIKLDSWESLADYNVAYITGWKIFDINVKQAKSIVKVGNKTQLFNLLHKDRTDLVLITRLAGLDTISKMGLSGIHCLEPPLVSTPMFLYLHKKHTPLITKLADLLRQIKEDGTYAELEARVLAPFQVRSGERPAD